MKRVYLYIYDILISNSDVALIDSVNPSHGTDACPHHQLIQFGVQMKVFNFIIPVQWRLNCPQKVV